jgi:hypothetical protein
MTPGVKITKADGQTGAVRPQPLGNLAIIAAAANSAIQNVPQTFTRQSDALSSAGLGPLVEYGSYFLDEASNPVLLIAPSTSTAGTISGQGSVKSGTSTPTWSGTPVDEYNNILVEIQNGGTIGVSGITYTVSFDGGQTTSGVMALGTASAIAFAVPAVGLSTGVTLTFGAGTLVTDDTFYAMTSRPMMNNSDLVTALEALRTSRLPWDNVLIDTDVTAVEVGTVDTWLAALEGVGVFKMAWMNTRHKNRPVPTTESEAQYAAYLGTLFASTSTIRVDVGADAADMSSVITGIVHPRPTSLFVATRAEQFPPGVDPAYVSDGNLGGSPSLTDLNGNPKWHDEFLYPGLDALRLSTLRSFPGDNGTYITNANLLSPSGSDYVYDQHARVMNLACTYAFQILQTQLSRGVRKQPPVQPSGAVYILEQDAQSIEALVNASFRQNLKGQVNAALFTLSRTDDLSPNSGATVNGTVQIQALAYIKNFNVVAKFAKSIAVPLAA